MLAFFRDAPRRRRRSAAALSRAGRASAPWVAASGVAALVHLGLAAVLAPSLAHPTEVYAPGTGCPEGYGWADVTTYAGLAVIVVLALAAAVRLLAGLRRGAGPGWLVVAAVAVVVLAGLSVLGADTVSCERVGFAFVERSTLPRVAAAVGAAGLTLAVLLTRWRRRA